MTHSRAAVAPWRGMVFGKRYYVREREDDLRYWQGMAAVATKRYRTVRRFVARRDAEGRIYIERTPVDVR